MQFIIAAVSVAVSVLGALSLQGREGADLWWWLFAVLGTINFATCLNEILPSDD